MQWKTFGYCMPDGRSNGLRRQECHGTLRHLWHWTKAHAWAVRRFDRAKLYRWFQWFGHRCNTCGKRVWRVDSYNAMIVCYARSFDGTLRPDEIHHSRGCYAESKRSRYSGRSVETLFSSEDEQGGKPDAR